MVEEAIKGIELTPPIAVWESETGRYRVGNHLFYPGIYAVVVVFLWILIERVLFLVC